MSEDLWIIVPNWDKFQHYKDRDPAWIKVYTDLVHRNEYLTLSAGSRAVLHGVWLLYALSHGVLSADSVHAQLKLRVTSRQLESLSDAGFIEFSASKPLALTRARGLAKIEEVEKEEDTRARSEPVEKPARARSEDKPGKPNEYHRAEQFTRNAGWQYLKREYVEELAKYDLDDQQRQELESLQASLAITNGELDW